MNTDKKSQSSGGFKAYGICRDEQCYRIFRPTLVGILRNKNGVSVSSFILPERVTVFTSPVSWLERTQNC